MTEFRSIVITGASGGIGTELARAFAGPGVALALIARDAARIEPLAEACRAAGAEGGGGGVSTSAIARRCTPFWRPMTSIIPWISLLPTRA